MAVINGTPGPDLESDTAGDDTITLLAGDDTLNSGAGGADTADLGDGDDIVNVSAAAAGQIRLTFTSAEVGNGNVNDSNTLANQDGGLAVRLQAEDEADGLTGPVSRYDDEGISFVAATAGVTFDVRDLVSGAQRGNQFEVVRLGTSAGDTLGVLDANVPHYINGGGGADIITDGLGDDFLVGGGGADTLTATGGADTFIGGSGNDTIAGGIGDDEAILNVATDGSDEVDLGDGSDVVTVNAPAGQVRLTFTSSEVGDGSADDSNTLANQDGGLAVRVQGEDGAGDLNGSVSRFDDEGVTFVAGAGVTFDVRDLVSGAQRGDLFEVVTLGTSGIDTLAPLDPARPTYINAGQGADIVTDGTGNDFLVGGAGADTLTASAGNDSMIGGGGDDTIAGGIGDDRAIVNVSTDGADEVDLGDGVDTVAVSAAAAGQVRLTFTSSEVGDGSTDDSNTLANQDGGLAVRLQAEDGIDGLTGPESRYDDEGVTFTSATTGLTFDVRDLPTGTQRGDLFQVVRLGTSAGNVLAASALTLPTYINGGGGADTVSGGNAADVLVGGAGADTLTGFRGQDTVLGGADNDTINTLDADADPLVTTAVAPEADSVDAGAGDDTVTGGLTDTLDGGIGTDLLNFDFGSNGTNPASAAAIALDAGGTGTLGDGTSITGFERFNFTLTGEDDASDTGDVDATVLGLGGEDTITSGAGDDSLDGGAGDDVLSSGAGGDTLAGGLGADTITGGLGSDSVTANVATDGADQVDLGGDYDVVTLNGGPGQVRVTFTSAEVGNGAANDANALANQDGGLAVRVQAEDGTGAPTGPVSRYDDEGVTFLAGAGVTFDVRDLVSGTQRGDQFAAVVLGTAGGDDTAAFQPLVPLTSPIYFNTGAGDDTVTAGDGADFLVGGAGADTLTAAGGNDSIIGGLGDDTVSGGDGVDTAIVNVSTDGADSVNLGAGLDVVTVAAAAAAQIRLTFTSAEVGNDAALDGGTLANQDGGLAVRLQAEDGTGALTGPVSRYDDEGIVFVAQSPGVTFDVRDLVAGTQRGDDFEVVVLGTGAADTLSALDVDRPYYFNAGAGDDTVTDSNRFDFLVGGAGADTLTASAGNDTLLGGGGDDSLTGGIGTDSLDGGLGSDIVSSSAASSTVYVDLDLDPTVFFDGTGSVDAIAGIEGAVGGSATDFLLGDGAANLFRGNGGNDALLGRAGNDTLDGGDGDDILMGGVGYDPTETGTGDDSIDGAAGGDILYSMDGNDTVNGGTGVDFVLAGAGNDSATGGDGDDFLFAGSAYEFDNAGAGNDTLSGGDGLDFIVGGDGNDVLSGDAGVGIIYGGSGNDSITGGSSNDTLVGEAGNDTIDGAGLVDFMYGEEGADTFVFRPGYAQDFVFDFSIAENDVLRLDAAFGIADLAAFQAAATTQNIDGIDYTFFTGNDPADVIRLQGVRPDQFTTTNFELG